MKRTGLRILLALVIASTLVIASVGTVSAARPLPVLSITITHKEAGSISFTYGWSGKTGVYSYFVGIYDNNNNPSPHYAWTKSESFSRRTTSASYTQTVTSVSASGNYLINLYVYDKKGNTIQGKSVPFSLP